MSKFPVEISDQEGIVDAVNYLLSGPAGLGQNFAGFSSYSPAYLTGNYRTPYSQPYTSGVRNLYVAPINLSTSEFVDNRTLKFTFSSVQPTIPFQQGNQITVSGVTIPPYVYDYNGSYTRIGVVECTTSYCTVRLSNPETMTASASGGTIELTSMDYDTSTDCNARVTVTGGTDRVFISGQLDQTITGLFPGGGDTVLTTTVRVNRYIGYLNEDPVNPDYLFDFDGTIAEKVFTNTISPGPSPITATLDTLSTIFTSIIDAPKPAYYWYIMEVNYSADTTAQVENVVLGLRSLSTQVVKQ